MSKGGWFVFVAIGGLAGASAPNEIPPPDAPVVIFNGDILECSDLGCWRGSVQQNNQQSQRHGADEPAAEKSDYAPSIVIQSFEADAPPAETPTDEETQREKDDLKAQQDMALWAFCMFVATAIGVGLIGWTLIETRKTANIARRSLDHAVFAGRLNLRQSRKAINAAVENINATREIGAAQSQAYLTIQNVSFQFALEEMERPDGTKGNKAVIYLYVQVKNTGQTPAHMIRYDLEGMIRVGETFERDLRRHVSVASKYASIGAGETPTETFNMGMWGLSEADMDAIVGHNPTVLVDVLCKHGTVFKGRWYSPMKQSFILSYWWQDFGSRFFEEHEMSRMHRLL